MSAVAANRPPLSEFRVFVRCTCIALLMVLCVIEMLGWHVHWFAHPQKTQGIDPTTFIEAQMVTIPEVAELRSAAPTAADSPSEAVISKEVNKGRKATAEDKSLLARSDQNVTKSAAEADASLGPTHGPVAVYTPAPIIPSYLTSQDLNRTVVIEFFVTAVAGVVPRLIVSSDNEELDAIAVATAKKWQFRPAEQGHKPVDSKVRLRIVFEVK